jgi:putative membrane protein
MNWKLRALEAAVGVVLIALPAFAQARQNRNEKVVSFIHQANLQEIEAAKLAQAKSSSQSVKDFAAQMVTDHQKADDQVRSYAQKHNIDLDTLLQRLRQGRQDQVELDRRAKSVGSATGEWAFTSEQLVRAKSDDDQTLDTLRTLDGAAFDREFVSAMVDGHQKVIDRLTGVRDRSIDPDLRSLIVDLLPSIKHHLEMAQALQETVSKA